MYGRLNTAFPRADHLLRHHSPSSSPDLDTTPPPSQPPTAAPSQLITPDDDVVQLSGFDASSGGDRSSCSYGSASSMTAASCGGAETASLMQRSISSHSLQRNMYRHYLHFGSPGVLDMERRRTVRKVFSTGDLQFPQSYQRAESPMTSESSLIIESMSKACKYSPEEKKEKIERYRIKRNLRNFNKKIKYVCRKTLADSRPRIRGRFAKNDEIEKKPQFQWSNNNNVSEELDDDDFMFYDEENWNNFLDAFSSNSFP